MKILCVGDSLALPREEVPYESTWYYKLKMSYSGHVFIDHFVRGLEICDAVHRYDTYFQHYDPDLVIIQTGVCDCAPRYINDRKFAIRIIIRLFKMIRLESLFWKIVKKGRRDPNCVITSYNNFLELYDRLITKLLSQHTKYILLIKIGHAAESTLSKSPFFNSNVDKFNTAIDKICEKHPQFVCAIAPLDDVEESDFVDGYHCNEAGMDKVYRGVKSALDDYFLSK